MKMHSGARALLFAAALLPAHSTQALEASAGCGAADMAAGRQTLRQGDVERHYRVYLPAGYSSSVPAPVVFYFHGWGGDEDELIDQPFVRSEADRRGYILVAPRGLGSGTPDSRPNSWSFRGSTTGRGGDGQPICDTASTPDYSYPSCADTRENTCNWTQCQADDVAFTLALVTEISSTLCVDTDRLFATGGSNGGMFTWELGQNPVSAPRFRALAPVIGLPHRGYLQGPAGNAGLPVLLITGYQDEVVPPGPWEDAGYTTTSNENDRFFYTGASAIMRSWALAHGCETSADAVVFETAYSEADCRTYCSPGAGWPPVLDCRADMGHEYGLDWSWQLILDFFDAHSPSS